MRLINDSVRLHETRAEWAHWDIAEVWHHYFKLFERKLLKVELPTPYLEVGRLFHKRMAAYCSGKNGVGADWQVTINERLVDRPLYEQLAYLLHMMVHIEEEGVRGKPFNRY